MAKKYSDVITLRFGHSLIVPHQDVPLGETFNQAPSAHILSAGLFNTASPNFQTYYPGVKSRDLVAKESDFIKPIFRALSMVIVNYPWDPVDFSTAGVLKASMDKLLGQTIYTNHEAVVGNELGSVSRVFWQDSYVDNGITIPAGINAEFKIDGKSHPNIARKINMDPPAIHSNSVTVQFLWEQSHPKLDRSEFMHRVGTMGSDGKLIRKIVSEIVSYHETSLVSRGADRFAQKVDPSGTIVRPKYASDNYKFSDGSGKTPHYLSFSYKDDLEAEGETKNKKSSIPKVTINKYSNTTMKNQLIRLCALMAITVTFSEGDNGEETPQFHSGDAKMSFDDVVAKLKNISSLAAEAPQNSVKLTEETGKVTTLTEKVSGLESSLEAILKPLRSQAEAAYRKVKGDKAKQSFIDSFKSMDFAGLSEIISEYNEEYEENHPLQCANCHSTSLTRASSSPDGDEDDDDDEEDEEEVANSGKKTPAHVPAGKKDLGHEASLEKLASKSPNMMGIQ